MAKAASSVSVSFRAPQRQVEKMDAIAKRQGRDRTQLLGEAIDQYLALHEFHLARIDEGIAAADRGDFASEEEVQAEFDRWRRK